VGLTYQREDLGPAADLARVASHKVGRVTRVVMHIRVVRAIRIH
jgi:hypothetical protein